MANLQGTNVAAPIRPFSSNDTYAVAHQNEIRGGWHSVDNITERNAIPQDRRQEMMIVAVRASKMTYQLQGGTDNVHWQEYGAFEESQLYFVTAGGVAPGDQEIELPVLFNGVINKVYANCKTPGTTNTAISIQKASEANYANNVWSNILAFNLSLPANSKVSSSTYSFSNPNVTAGDHFKVSVPVVGSGLEGLSVVLNIQKLK